MIIMIDLSIGDHPIKKKLFSVAEQIRLVISLMPAEKVLSAWITRPKRNSPIAMMKNPGYFYAPPLSRTNLISLESHQFRK